MIGRLFTALAIAGVIIAISVRACVAACAIGTGSVTAHFGDWAIAAAKFIAKKRIAI